MDIAVPALSSSPTLDAAGFGALLNELKTKPKDARGSQQALLAFGRRTNAQPPLAILMQDAVALVGEILGADMGSVGEVRGEHLQLTATAWDGDGKASALRDHECPLDEANSMAAYALRSGSVTVSPDLRAERRFRDVFLQGMGLAAALVVPLHVNGKPFGVLGIHATAPREFTLDNVTFAETMAHMLSASIARIQMEQKLQEAHAISSGLLEMVDTMVLTLDAEGCVVDMNRACEETTKFHLANVRNQPFWQTLVAPEEADLVRVIFESSLGSRIPSDFEGFLLAKNGTRRKVSWSLKVLSTGQVQTILMTGRERTTPVAATAESGEPRPAASPASALGENYESPFHLTATDATAVQKRRSARRDYRYRQRMAPMNGNTLPAASEFVEVDCWDISAGGVSFFVDRLPNFETLVVALGRPPALSYFSARVMRVARVEENGTARYLIGCTFLGRVHLPKTRV